MGLIETLSAMERDHPAGHFAEWADAIKTVVEFSEKSRKQYADTKQWTTDDGGSCMTIRVPVALLKRIVELGES